MLCAPSGVSGEARQAASLVALAFAWESRVQNIDADRLYARLTWRLVPFLFLCYICAYLDRVNVGFAKLAMQDQLGFSETVYGLSGYVSGTDAKRVADVANQLRCGNVHVNGAGLDFHAPFGGYKQSGNGREWGEFGFEEFLEVKAVMNTAAA